MEYLPLVSVVNVSQFSILCDYMERYSPLCALVHICECFLHRTSSISVALVEYLPRAISEFFWFEGGRGDNEYGPPVVFHISVMQLGSIIPNLVFTSRVLSSGTPTFLLRYQVPTILSFSPQFWGPFSGAIIQDLEFGTFLKKAPQRQNLGLWD